MGINILNRKNRMVTLQLLGWGVILATTLFWSFGSNNEGMDLFGFVIFATNILMLLVIYLLNYLLFIPRLLFKDKVVPFVLSNFLVIVILLVLTYFINESGLLDALRPADLPQRPRTSRMYLMRDVINDILMIGLVAAMRLVEKLQKSEEALREAESARIKAELDNLRSQINPHFLLNTLNNIYALTAIDAEKAQKTIKELSDLLRYILYDNLNDKVPLLGEVDFLKSYIELMSIRLPRKVSVKTEFRISEGSAVQIAPMIFISLIENAFKHSVSAAGEGFIEIHFEEFADKGEVILSIKNSNHAKADEDKSGHGIGLEQVRRRLELLYPEAYQWDVEQSGGVYKSVLKLRV
ncbi:MAG: sensor histidine kinase [Rikenellaceae bacterium]